MHIHWSWMQIWWWHWISMSIARRDKGITCCGHHKPLVLMIIQWKLLHLGIYCELCWHWTNKFTEREDYSQEVLHLECKQLAEHLAWSKARGSHDHQNRIRQYAELHWAHNLWHCRSALQTQVAVSQVGYQSWSWMKKPRHEENESENSQLNWLWLELIHETHHQNRINTPICWVF